ncbi:MAG: tocopherol cyclase family protein [Bacteroidota bacterium]
MKPFHQAFHLLHRKRWVAKSSKSEAFEGYYFKISDREGQVVIFIVGICRRNDEAFAFLQVAHHRSSKPQLYKYPLSSLLASKTDVSFQLGNNHFSAEGIYIREKDCSVRLTFDTVSAWKRTSLHPSIMGPLAYVPGVECKHDIIASHLHATGECRIAHQKIHFHRGDGYIDKNWGTSFPSSYYWGHAHAFSASNLSIQFAKGKPKWGVIQPEVHVGFIRLENSITTFSSHNGGKLELFNEKENQTKIILKNRKWKVELVISNAASTSLYAPHKGQLSQSISESIGGYSEVTIYRKDGTNDHQKILRDFSHSTTFECHNWATKSGRKRKKLR